MEKTMKRNQTGKRNKKESKKEPKKARNYIQEDADYFSRNYTNERIRVSIGLIQPFFIGLIQPNFSEIN